MIAFNKPYFNGKEIQYISEAVKNGKISGNGVFTKRCQDFFQKRYGFKKSLLTTSCTDALEMCAILSDIKLEDEVIIPSYTFVSTALAFVRQGAKIIFVDSNLDNPNINTALIEPLITHKTKAIVIVHYAGISCDMEEIMKLAVKYNLIVIEDAAQSIDSYYKGKALGGIGHLSAFSFHETKNISSGEGGMLVINDDRFIERSEIIWEKGTNRSKFFRGEIDKYGWVDIGSSFLPSEISAAFLLAQLEQIDNIQEKRKKIWDYYLTNLTDLSNKQGITLPQIPIFATNNAHMFYLVCKNHKQRTDLIQKLKDNNILSVFHYLSLHKSPYYIDKHDGRELPNSDRYSECLMRLPLYYDLTIDDIDQILDILNKFFKNE